MGFLNKNTACPELSKVIVAFWFYATSEDVAAAKADASGGVFARSIPLICFGARQNDVSYESHLVDVLTVVDGENVETPTYMQLQYGDEPITGDDFGPCYISLYCGGDDPRIEAQIQTKTTASVVNLRNSVTSVSAYLGGSESPPDPSALGDGIFAADWGVGVANGITDYSYSLEDAPQNVFIRASNNPITADHWHHVLFSFDLTAGVATHGRSYPSSGPGAISDQTTAAFKIHLCIDGQDISGADLGGAWVEGGDPNDFIPDTALSVALDYRAELTGGDPDLIVAASSYDLTNARVGSGPIGIPAPTTYGSSVKEIAMSDMYVWAGRSTTAEAYPLFVQGGAATDGSAAITAFGTPIVRFKAVSDWQNGRNRGSAGSFAKTGTIAAFGGSPSLS